ncbi:sortase [Candidatus Saccharibacteria bacterium]|nr:sortase [Candidatus Saccharibacteria bacterium]MCL1962745.1 sortase [Candidatus Saccharibacteria bacterium]
MNDDQTRPNRTRDAAAGIVRERIDRIFDTHRPMIEQTARVPEERSIVRGTERPSSRSSDAETRAVRERYHASWQNYYQKYYEDYYVNAVKQQNHDFNQKLSEIAAANNVQPAVAVQNVGGAAFPLAQPSEKKSQTSEAVKGLQNELVGKIKTAGAKARKSRHFIPAICAIAVILLILFIQYNQLLFAQINSFISPGAMTDQTIIVGTGAGDPVGPDPRVVIPKINVSAPVIYGLMDLSEANAQEALKSGTIHYSILGASATPGQKGNTVILGHSSSDWFSNGQYKFIFVQLNKLVVGDLFYLDYNSVRYTYKVFKTEIINPNQLDKLNLGTKKPYATLVTCDPPGTALHRLVVYAEQISPDPASVTTSQGVDGVVTGGDITGTPPTLFERALGR